MIEMTNKILSEISPEYGFCDFDSIRDSLIDCRGKALIPEKAKSVIVMLFPYNLGEEFYEGSDISKYAVVPDYHAVISSLLKSAAEKLKLAYPDEEFVTFTDNSPIPEVRAAINAGLGVKGLNGLFISKTYGSWVFIGEIVTTKAYPTAATEDNLICCGCNKCVEACPTKAIGDKGIDTERCLSFITQKKGELSTDEENLIKQSGCAWGCDVCQNVCPMNNKALVSPVKAFMDDAQPNARTKDIKDRAYAWRGEKVIRRNLEILKSDKRR